MADASKTIKAQREKDRLRRKALDDKKKALGLIKVTHFISHESKAFIDSIKTELTTADTKATNDEALEHIIQLSIKSRK